MSNASTTFFAARLVDNDKKLAFNRYRIDAESREAVLTAAEAIKKENHTPEQINAMLGVILANTGEMLTDEDRNTVFQGVTPAESKDPYSILLGPVDPMLYGALREIAEDDSQDATATSESSDELKKAQDDLAAKSAEASELASKVEQLTKDLEAAGDPDGLRVKVKELMDAAAGEETRTAEAVAEKTGELNKSIEKLTESNKVLENTVFTLSTEKHNMLAREAAHLATKAAYPAAKGKSFEELCETFASRSEESLNDLIGDLFAAPESASQPAAPAAPHVDASSVPHVADPTEGEEQGIPAQPVEHGNSPASETPLQSEMVDKLTDTQEQTYYLLNFTSKNRADLKSKLAQISGK